MVRPMKIPTSLETKICYLCGLAIFLPSLLMMALIASEKRRSWWGPALLLSSLGIVTGAALVCLPFCQRFQICMDRGTSIHSVHDPSQQEVQWLTGLS